MSDQLASRLGKRERALLNLEDHDVEILKEKAQAGNMEAQRSLYLWAAVTARNYYYLMVQRGDVCSAEEAETLAADFLLEFERTLPRLRKAVHWTRSLLPRYLVYTRHRQHHARKKTVPTDPNVLAEFTSNSGGTVSSVMSRWDDEQWLHLRAALRTLEALPEFTRQIIRRIFWDDSAPTYHDLAVEFGTTEAAIKMRVSRFYRAVRRAA